MNTHLWLSRAITALLSILQASDLRNRMYLQSSRIETLELALEDVERINARSANPNALISGICANTLGARVEAQDR